MEVACFVNMKSENVSITDVCVIVVGARMEPNILFVTVSIKSLPEQF